MTLAIDPTTGVEVAVDAVARAKAAGAHDAKVVHRFSEKFEVNFDTNDITLVRSTVADAMSITVYVDNATGSAELTGRSHDAVDLAVAQAVTSAQAGAPDPANVLPADPAEPAESDGDDRPDEEAMVDVVLRHIESMREHYPLMRTDSSSYMFQNGWTSYANSHGRTQHARQGRYVAQVMVTGKDGDKATSFNYTAVVSRSPLTGIFELEPVQTLCRDTMASFDAIPIPETFVGDLIFTPESLSTLVGSVSGAHGGMALLRKATPFADALGTTVASPLLSLLHRPSALSGADAFDSEGFPNRDLDVISAGVLEHFLIGWYTSHKLDRPMTTGQADLLVAPGETPLEELIASTKRGIVLGRFSGGTPNQALDFSGVAKNSFYVEDGRIVGPIAETMVAGNFRACLENIRAISRETVDHGYSRNPWLATTGVTISTK